MLVGRVFTGLPRAKSRHLDRLGSDKHVHQSKAPPDEEGAAEQRLYLLRCRIGRNVEILGCDAEQQIAYGAADDEGPESSLLQFTRHFLSTARNLTLANPMRGGTVDARFLRYHSGDPAREQPANHGRSPDGCVAVARAGLNGATHGTARKGVVRCGAAG